MIEHVFFSRHLTYPIAKLGDMAHVVARKATNTVEDIKSGDAAHIIARKAKNTGEDVKHFAEGVGEKLKPATDKIGEVAHQVRQRHWSDLGLSSAKMRGTLRFKT